MKTNLRLTLCWSVAFCSLAACSQGASNAASNTGPDTSASASTQAATDASANGALANPCDHAITAADMAGILIGPLTRRPAPDCAYQTQTKAYTSILVGKGDAAKGAWMLATTYNATKNPLAGVGDEALYSPGGTTLIARKGDLSCRVDVVGYDNSDAMDSITKDRDEALARKLGALCSKVFASQ